MNFAIVYSCSEDPTLGRVDLVWILSRKPHFTDDTKLKVNEIMTQRLPFYSADNFKYSMQSEQCPYIIYY